MVNKTSLGVERHSHTYRMYLIRNIIDNDDAIGSSVVASSDCPEPLLTSSVPLPWGNHSIIHKLFSILK